MPAFLPTVFQKRINNTDDTESLYFEENSEYGAGLEEQDGGAGILEWWPTVTTDDEISGIS